MKQEEIGLYILVRVNRPSGQSVTARIGISDITKAIYLKKFVAVLEAGGSPNVELFDYEIKIGNQTINDEDVISEKKKSAPTSTIEMTQIEPDNCPLKMYLIVPGNIDFIAGETYEIPVSVTRGEKIGSIRQKIFEKLILNGNLNNTEFNTVSNILISSTGPEYLHDDQSV